MRGGRARRSAAAAVLGLVLLVAPAYRAAALDLESILKASSFSAEEKEEIQSVFIQADRGGIPRDLLLPRLAEGSAKRVPYPRMISVLRSWQQNLDNARGLLQSQPAGEAILADTASWQLAATLLETGASPAEVRALVEAAGAKPAVYRAGGLLYASLVGWGVPRVSALKVTRAALRSSIPPQQFPGLISLFERGRQLRVPPDRLADRVVEALPGAKTIDELGRAVLY